jgi:eukaryotic-like serine/threonine-protein kinase
MGIDARIQEIFLAAVEATDSEARRKILDRECGSDVALRNRVAELLAGHDGSGDHFEFSAAHPALTEETSRNAVPDVAVDGPAPTSVTQPSRWMGRTIGGRYRLLELIGEGGMGSVWIAEQRQPMKRLVALKLIKSGMETKTVLARFEAERQVLALMDHPNIAKVLDGGTTDEDYPFFVMELVRGIPLTRYCDDRKLTIPDRLLLFVKVCQAIQHAHQKGIIHRDIKPSNILVTDDNDRPIPKVIDFGLAKPLQGIRAQTDRTLYTMFGAVLGTPPYMAPEQVDSNAMDVDTRTDIYALGAVLYELLTGSTPIESHLFDETPWDGICRLIRYTDAPRPSTRISASQETTKIADRRCTEPDKLGKMLRGDLDWIVLKALEKDRSRRYETANGLAVDIQRYLTSEPVTARPPTNLYRLGKLIRRNRLAFTAICAVLAALTFGLGLSTLMFLQERAARQRAVTAEKEQFVLRQQADDARQTAIVDRQKATTEATRSQAIAVFMKDMLKSVGPKVALGRDTTMLREILDQTVQRLDSLSAQPSVEADLRDTLGNVYLDLGEYQSAEAMHRSALKVRKDLYGEEHPDVARSQNDLAQVLYGEGNWAEAESMHRDALAVRRKVYGPEHPEVAESLNNLAESIRRQKTRYDEAEAMHREALAMRRKLLGPEHPDVASSLNNLGLLLWIRGTLGEPTFTEAESLHRKALALRRKLFGDAHPDVATSLDRLGLVLHWEEKYPEAEGVQRDALAMRRRLLGNEHPDLAHSLFNLANTLNYEGKSDEAQPLLTEALSIRKKILGARNGEVATTLNLLSLCLSASSNLTSEDARQALDYATQACDIVPNQGIFLSTRGIAHFRAGDFESARADLLKSVEMRRSGNTLDFSYLAMAYWKLGEMKEALDCYSKAMAWMDMNTASPLQKRAQLEAAKLLEVSSD